MKFQNKRKLFTKQFLQKTSEFKEIRARNHERIHAEHGVGDEYLKQK
ncbi:MAG: hypothetical protein KAQ64_01340 [Candidatus Pacebacteria bacterium]|nr:hypothetical protein [Candidatus Paceibacterota bacterium]